MGRIAAVLVAFVALALAGVYAAGKGWLGERWGEGDPAPHAVPAAVVAARAAAQRAAASDVGAFDAKQIVFGDLHVHSTYSVDAFQLALPASGGDGAHPVADACDFARFCSALDFWSINDHAMSHTPRTWAETIDSIRACNAVASDAASPDTVAYLGWEWTQMGSTAANHYGHKNVVLRDLDDEHVPARPIAARPPSAAKELQSENASPSPFALGLLPLVSRDASLLDFATLMNDLIDVPACPRDVPVRDLPSDCREDAETPRELFDKLDDWGFASIVIPHGTTWGTYTPLGSSWDKQLNSTQHDPQRQTLIEVFSGHGNSEEFRPFEEISRGDDGSVRCPGPQAGYLPSCRQAGEIVRSRCAAEGESEGECDARAAKARQDYVDADVQGWLAVPATKAEDWLDSGQCRDCFQPAFNYRPKSSLQYMLALRSFDPRGPERFRFGVMASSDNHSARPGTGYKEIERAAFTESRFATFRDSMLGGRDGRAPEARSIAVDLPKLMKEQRMSFFALRETERGASFFLNGGLIAAHSAGRDRDSIWQAMERREVYGTSGPRILLWFDLLNAPGARGRALPMGGEVAMSEAPIFRVRAVGSFEQKPGCPEFTGELLDENRIERLCRGECYNPSDVRRPISRIEVVRIRPQIAPGEPIAPLIEDPWQVFPCDGAPEGCAAHFSDPDFGASGRDAVYYARAIEAPSPAVNAGGLRCERDATGACVRIHPCVGVDAADDCLAETEERAWSSPIYVDHAASTAPR
ncbi:MAG: DUF3604 domain-containing protein [Myxococcales bacterium]|nr:DUF3604 domain-containing protein [Myxococcales bacterium]